MREEVEIVDGVGVRDAHVHAGPLEAGEAAGQVTDRPDPTDGQGFAEDGGNGMEAENVADLQHATARDGQRGQAAPVGGRHRQGLLHETVATSVETGLGDGAMTVGRRDHIDRVDLRERGP